MGLSWLLRRINRKLRKLEWFYGRFYIISVQIVDKDGKKPYRLVLCDDKNRTIHVIMASKATFQNFWIEILRVVKDIDEADILATLRKQSIL